MNDFDYLNARVRGMSTLLLTHEFYEQVLSAVDEKSAGTTAAHEKSAGTTAATILMDALLASCYGEELQKAMTERGGSPAAVAIETAARRTVRAAFVKILAISPTEPRRLLALQLNRWDVANVMTLLRGKLAGASPPDVLSAVLPIGELDEVQLGELAAESDLGDMADALVTWKHGFASTLRRAIRECRPQDDRKALEAAVYRAWFALAFSQLNAPDPLHAPLRDILRRQVDLANVISLLDFVRSRERGVTREAPEPIPCGTFAHPLLDELAASETLEGAFEILEATYFAPAIEKGILAFGQTRSLAVMERFLEVIVIARGCRLFRQDVLSLSLPLGFIWRKYSELVNLRMLARGTVYRMPANAVREGMIIV